MSSNNRRIFGKQKRLSLKFIFFSLLTLLITIVGYGYFALKASLPVLDGEKVVASLSAPVSIQRDNLGIVDISANNRNDLATALGYVHAQERFFQMDLSRRNSAGELSALFGRRALAYDKKVRIHEFKIRANLIFNSLPKEQQHILSRYTQGVNQGLADLREKPFEYLLLRKDPETWTAQDSLLVVYSMYLSLQSGDGYREHLSGELHRHLPRDVFDFLLPRGTRWDAPLQGDSYTSADIPPPESWQQLKINATRLTRESGNKEHTFAQQLQLSISTEFESSIGSNNWAVSGQMSPHKAAILAGDMHLGIRVPNTWFRAQMHYPREKNMIDLYGITLPGTPLLIAGSNSNIAWSFTNSYGDWSDLIRLVVNESQTHYKTADGFKEFDEATHSFMMDNGEIEKYQFKKTIWGPVITHGDQLYAYHWIAHEREGLNLGLLELEHRQSIISALEQAKRSSIPAQNFVVVDKEGNIGWTLIGPIPSRTGFRGRIPQDWSTPGVKWSGFVEPEDYPSIINPLNQYIWTANTRVVSGAEYAKIGDGGYALGARARQIRDNLASITMASEKDLLGIQLDDKAVFLDRWRKLILDQLEDNSSAELIHYKQHVINWSGRASKDDVGYRLVRQFRRDVAAEVLNPLYRSAFSDSEDPPSYYQFTQQYEAPLWAIVSQQPEFLLPQGFTDWNQLYVAQVKKELERITNSQKKLEESSWGSHNTAQIKHPLSGAVPLLGLILDMPGEALSGDRDMPRVQGKQFGASQRMVVSPGHETEGIFHMPTGQSGHPLSPSYGIGHSAWVNGTATPFLMQTPVHQLVLKPEIKN